MIVDKEDFDSDIVDTINNAFEEYKLEWVFNISDDKTVLQIIVYNYNQDMYISDLASIEDELYDTMCRTLGFSVFTSYIQFNTGNIILSIEIDLIMTNWQLINNIVNLIKILKLWKK